MTSPLFLSLGVVLAALCVIVPVGLWLGYLQARKRYRGKTLVDILILLPLILPPSVVGYFLLLLLGRDGFLGALIEEFFGVRLVFSFWGAVIAAGIVAFPMMAKGAEAAFSRIEKDLEEAGQMDGLSPMGVFLRITLPLSRAGVAAAVLLTAGRALGEFGATLMFAGNVAGHTNTLPLEMYTAFQINDDERALFLSLLLVLISSLLALLLSLASRA
jgi:molybdate transport system permease protein